MRFFKRIGLTLVMASVVSFAVAQKANVTNAIMTYSDFTKAMQAKDMAKARKHLIAAKQYIDLAQAHPDTKDQPKTLFNLGQIYLTLGGIAANDPELKTKFNAEELIKTGKDALTDCYKKSTPKDGFKEDIKRLIIPSYTVVRNMGANAYGKANYDSAVIYFAGAIELKEIMSETDTAMYYFMGQALENLAYSASNTCTQSAAKECPKADSLWKEIVKVYEKGKVVGYNKGEGASSYAKALRMNKMWAEERKVLDEGRAKFPKNNNLIIEDFLFYSEQGDNASAEKVINDAIAKNPKDVVLFYLQGIALSGMGRNDDAVAAYNKAIEINPKYFDAYYNIGNLYYNQGVAKIEKINEIKDNALYTKEKAAAEEFFKQAIPYLEKAREINPKDRDTRIMLKNIYFRLNMTDKYTEVNNSLKNG